MVSSATTPAPSANSDSAIRLIAIDIDGTLLDSKGHIPEANHQAIQNATAKGIEVVLATGRSFHHARPIAERLGTPLILIVSNGALVKRPNGTTLGSNPIPRHLARDLVVATRPVRTGAALIFDRSDARQYIYERIHWAHPQRTWYYERNKAYMTAVEPLEVVVMVLDEEPVQIAFNGSVAEMRALNAHVRKLESAKNVTLTLTEYEHRDFSLLDITAAGCSKGATLSDWASRRKIRPGEIMAVGDNLNDLEMLQLVGHPVVMGNAVPKLKERANDYGWPLTADYEHDGLAQAIKIYVSKNRPAPATR